MINKLWVLVITLLLMGGGNVWATVSGQCSTCHTMHNSQDGSAMAVDSDGNDLGVNRSLTKGDCVGCHTGTNGTDPGDIPYIMTGSTNTYGPDYETTENNSLAGGTFDYVNDNTTATNAMGHNVLLVATADTLTSPPGWVATTFAPSDGGNISPTNVAPLPVADLWGSKQLTCAGTNGCHGNHTNPDDFGDIRGAHHGDDSTIDGTTVAKSYRFLRGILGKEDPGWEYEVTSALHNQYYGVDRANVSTGSTMDKQTISYLCAQCHGLFHSDASTNNIIYSDPDSPTTVVDNANPWMRHPTDFSLKTAGGEYESYANVAGTAATSPGTTAEYNYIAPLASTNVSAVLANPFSGTGNDIVTCISCHRAHGSKYADLLRWDYSSTGEMIAGGGYGNKGCFACHTTKD